MPDENYFFSSLPHGAEELKKTHHYSLSIFQISFMPPAWIQK